MFVFSLFTSDQLRLDSGQCVGWLRSKTGFSEWRFILHLGYTMECSNCHLLQYRLKSQTQRCVDYYKSFLRVSQAPKTYRVTRNLCRPNCSEIHTINFHIHFEKNKGWFWGSLLSRGSSFQEALHNPLVLQYQVLNLNWSGKRSSDVSMLNSFFNQ